MNVILLISDTFRFDNLNGNAWLPVRTPNLDAFRKRAVSLSSFFTSSFPTIPHRTDLITGRFGWPWYGWQDLSKSSRNCLPRTLGKSGYVSQLLCDCPHLFKAGFQFGFDAAQAVRGQEGDKPFLRLNHPFEQVMPLEKTRPQKNFLGHHLCDVSQWTNRMMYREEDRFAPRTARLAIEWLEENYVGLLKQTVRNELGIKGKLEYQILVENHKVPGQHEDGHNSGKGQGAINQGHIQIEFAIEPEGKTGKGNGGNHRQRIGGHHPVGRCRANHQSNQPQ